MGTEEYKVTIGEDIFTVEADDNLSARYEAASRFRLRYGLDNIPLSKIVEHARAKLVTPFEPTETTKDVLSALVVTERR